MFSRGLLIFAFTFMLACSKHNEFEQVYSVPAELQKHINSFINEAAKRGHVFSIKNLIIQYDDRLVNLVCGTCNSTSRESEVQKIISIRNTSANQCWGYETELETLIFHELGHCFLGRKHLNELLPKGDPKSIMVENNLSLYSTCLYPIGPPCDNYFKRSYYLDELFDENTPVPDWGK
jgi:hypothetical protein